MAMIVTAGAALSVAANSKSSDLVTGRNQYIGKGRVQVIARSSAVGMLATLNVGGTALADDNPIVFTGAAGGLDVQTHVLIDQVVAGGRIEFFLRNSTGGALTTDYIIYFTPM